ncbi:DNA polymerase III subunit beta [Ornithinibacillus contaminans]|uniref:DNA polymerase III subunit beta n=1 Tax=Ornithinibacillus contaminans TaxID=694055 RepID=UPI00064DBDF0|nr:DNA polymerase III subunit beta [Ornithinibacillus contaminans]
MEFKINKVHFNEAVSEVSRAISSKTVLPILSGIKIEVKTDRLILVGSNSEIVIEETIPIEIDGESIIEIIETGSIVISARYLSEIIKKMPNDIYIKVTDKHSVILQSDEIITKINGLDATEYPQIAEIKSKNSISIAGKDLLTIIKQTIFAASKSETSPVLTGVNFYFQKDMLTCVATNSQRLSLIKHKIESDLIGSYTVPSASLSELLKVFANYPKEIEIFVSESTIVFKSDTITVSSKLIKGKYPNAAGLIPQQSSTTITLDTVKLLKGIDRASIFAGDSRHNNIRIQLDSSSKIKISSKSSEMGQIEESQFIKHISGEETLTISLDSNFMLEALKGIKEDEVTISFNGSMRPVMIQPVGNDSQLQLISPVRSN